MIRLKLLLFIFCTLIISLIIRTYYLQGVKSDKLFKSASMQHQSSLNITPRGNILDRNGITLTNDVEKKGIVLKSCLLKDEDIKKIGEILTIDSEKLKKQLKLQDPTLLELTESQVNQIKSLKINGISFINYLDRYKDTSLAKHVIGYLNKVDKIGQTGLEKFYEPYLKPSDTTIIGSITDARDHLLQGVGYRILKKKSYPYNIHLTLDASIQKVVENIMDKNSINGAVVVENIHNGDILAMASKPDYDQNNVAKYLASSKDELFNKSTASYNPGSVFKIISVISAIENIKDYNKEFFCNGYAKLGDQVFRCTSHKRGGHGYVNFYEAFSLSCNPYFINLGLTLGYKNIVETANKFGLGTVTGIKEQGVFENKGNIVTLKNFITDGDIANISLGQGDILATPVQVADILATIANDGVKNKVNIVDSVRDSDNNIIKKIKITDSKRILSPDTIKVIKQMLFQAVENGTGSLANLDGYGGSAGKTGSAETGQYISGEKIVDAWFAGYFPNTNPQFSIAVFIKNGKSGGSAAAPLFAEIAKGIINLK